MTRNLNSQKPLVAGANQNHPVGLAYQSIRELIPDLLHLCVPLLKQSANGTFVALTPEDLERLDRNPATTVFIQKQHLDSLLARLSDATRALNRNTTAPAASFTGNLFGNAPDVIFELKMKEMRTLSPVERIQFLINAGYRLSRCIQSQTTLTPELFFDLEKTITHAFCINKISLEESSVQTYPSELLEHLAAETVKITESIIRLFHSFDAGKTGINWLDCVETGCRAFDHANRVFFLNLMFLKYYNDYFNSHSNEISRFRTSFKERFFTYYYGLLKQKQYVTLSYVFKKGMSQLPESLLLRSSLGALLHDIGMQSGFQHLEDGFPGPGWKAAGNKQHAQLGYTALARSRIYSWDIASAALLHHEYYGAPAGYAQAKTFQYTCSLKESRVSRKDYGFYCLSFDLLDVVQGGVLAYFPHKVLEMIDLFDRLSTGRDPLNPVMIAPEKVLGLMRIEHLDEDHPALDPILFDIFIDFMAESCRQPGLVSLKI